MRPRLPDRLVWAVGLVAVCVVVVTPALLEVLGGR